MYKESIRLTNFDATARKGGRNPTSSDIPVAYIFLK